MRHDAPGQEATVFTQDALLLIGHGSSIVPDAVRMLQAHAEVIRSSSDFAQVEVGALVGEPDAARVFAALTAPVVHIVPFFLEDGYFTRLAIPDRILPLASSSRLIRFCPPVGSNDGIADILAARILSHCELFGTDPKDLSVLLIGHGSARGPGRARSLRRHAATLEAGGQFGWIRTAYLEEAPFVADALASSRGHIVAALGFLLNEGVHATKDVPSLIAAERMQRGAHWPPVHYLGSIGGDAAMPRLIMEQVVATNTM
jgi:sirohydrochlorin cobaltochelatase